MPLAFSRLVETPMVTTIHGFSSERILPAFKALRGSRPLCRDQRCRSPSGPALCRNDPPRHPAGGFSFRSARQRRPAVLRPHPSRQGRSRGDRGGTSRGRRLIMAGIVQDQDYYNEQVAPALDERSVVYRGPVGGAARTETLWARRARCSTSSISTSRSDCRWSRRWPAARRSSPATADRCPS